MRNKLVRVGADIDSKLHLALRVALAKESRTFSDWLVEQIQFAVDRAAIAEVETTADSAERFLFAGRQAREAASLPKRVPAAMGAATVDGRKPSPGKN